MACFFSRSELQLRHGGSAGLQLREKNGGAQRLSPCPEHCGEGSAGYPQHVFEFTSPGRGARNPMTILSQILRRITTTRHTRALESELARQGGELARQGAELTQLRAENDQQRAAIAAQQNELARHVAEIARLRGENRALLNSILGIAGIPPILPERLPDPALFALANASAISGAPLRPSVPTPAVPFPAKCHSESAAADDESRSAPSHPSSTAADKNSPGPQTPRNDIPPKPQPESSSLRSPSHPSPHSSSPSSFDSSSQSSPTSPSSPPVPAPAPSRPRRQLPTPLRRRSWHQIMRTLELASAKKISPTD